MARPTDRHPQTSPPGGRLRLPYLLGGVALALLGVAMAGPSLQILVAQVRLMADDYDAAEAVAKRRAYETVVARETRLQDVNRALEAAADGRPEDPSPRADHGNGLYAYLRLLPRLPSAKPRFATHPADGADLVDDLRALRDAPPVRLYAARHRALSWAAFQTAGVTPREAARDADMWTMRWYAPVYRPVLRRLAGGLLAQAEAWREAGRAVDAVAADEAVARLMLDLVDDSPRPDVVLLAAQYLPVALQGLAEEAAAANLSPDVAGRCIAEQGRIQALRERWHQAAVDGANILPRAPTIARARSAHRGVLGAILASAYMIGVWLILGLICLVFSLTSAGIWSSGPGLRWRWNGWGRLVAVGIVAGPMLVVVLVLLCRGLPFVWLYSMGSVWAFGGAMLLVPVLVGLAARTCVCLPEADARVWPLRKAVVIMAVVALLLVAITAVLPAGHKPWQPPAGVQVLRRVGLWIALQSLMLMLVWVIWGGLRRRRWGLRRGPRSAANFGAAVWSWVAATALGLIVLQVNAHRDLRHEAAFVAAAQDPLADELGPGWRVEHFQGARELLARIR